MPTPILHNRKSKEDLLKELEQEDFERVTISFYRYVRIEDPQKLRDQLYRKWRDWNCRGRIYVAKEGINAQMNVPEPHFEAFKADLYEDGRFCDVPFKFGVEQDNRSFLKLTIKVKDKIVADGLAHDIDFSKVGQHLTAGQWNQLLDDPDSICVDMRNAYESEVGHFEGAVCPDSLTYREELPMVLEMLKDKKDKKIMTYCTGGIRCEKASAFLREQGFQQVYQLQGGIIEYAHQVREKKLPSKFKGKNFVFDERIGERITDDVLAHCHQCEAPCDQHVNCRNEACNLLFIQCLSCEKEHHGCCSDACRAVAALPLEERRKQRKGVIKSENLAVCYRGKEGIGKR